MGTIYSSRGATIGLGQETSYNSAAGRTIWRPLISASISRHLTKTPRPTLRVGSAGATRRAHFTSEDVVGGDFVCEASHYDMGLLLKNVLGAAATTGSGDPYTHTYTIADDVPVGLTLEMVRGTGSGETFTGCRIESATFDVSAGGVMTVSCSVIGKTAAARGSASTPSISGTDDPILHSQAGTLAFGGNTFTLNSMSLTISNGLARRQRLGASATAQPLRADFQSVEMSVTLEVDDQLLTDHLNDTESDAVITFTSGTHSTAFTVHNSYLSAATDPVSDAGIITQSCTLVGQSDGTDEGLKIVNLNARSSAVG